MFTRDRPTNILPVHPCHEYCPWMQLSPATAKNCGRALELEICAREREDYNLNVLLPRTLRPTMVPLLQQRVATGQRCLQTALATAATGDTYSSLTGEQQMNNRWNNGRHRQYNANRCRWQTSALAQILWFQRLSTGFRSRWWTYCII